MKVLIATDGSACSAHAVNEAMRLLPLKQSDVLLVSVAVLPPVGLDPVGYGMVIPPDNTSLIEELSAQNRRQLEETAAEMARNGIVVRTFERTGDPATEVLDLARTEKVDMIVLGSHGRGALGRLVLGSVSDRVVHNWEGAVMVVRPGVSDESGQKTPHASERPRLI
jgi:nucleotide-binding universal stress UspA family protein